MRRIKGLGHPCHLCYLYYWYHWCHHAWLFISNDYFAFRAYSRLIFLSLSHWCLPSPIYFLYFLICSVIWLVLNLVSWVVMTIKSSSQDRVSFNSNSRYISSLMFVTPFVNGISMYKISWAVLFLSPLSDHTPLYLDSSEGPHEDQLVRVIRNAFWLWSGKLCKMSLACQYGNRRALFRLCWALLCSLLITLNKLLPGGIWILNCRSKDMGQRQSGVSTVRGLCCGSTSLTTWIHS